MVVGEAATGVARDQGVSGSLVGLTVVAAGTSAPEFSMSLMAALEGLGSIGRQRRMKIMRGAVLERLEGLFRSRSFQKRRGELLPWCGGHRGGAKQLRIDVSQALRMVGLLNWVMDGDCNREKRHWDAGLRAFGG